MANGTDQKPTYVGIATTAGLVGWILQLKIPGEQKLMYIAIIAVGGFAAYIVRFFLHLYEGHVSKQTDTMVALMNEGRRHDELSTEAHKKQCLALQEVTRSLRSMNGKGVKKRE